MLSAQRASIRPKCWRKGSNNSVNVKSALLLGRSYMHQHWRVCVAIVLVVYYFLTNLGCDGHVGVSGVVVDETGAPVQQARVSLRDAGFTVAGPRAVASDGTYWLSSTVAPSDAPVELVVTINNFEVHTEQLGRNSDFDDHRIVLNRSAFANVELPARDDNGEDPVGMEVDE